MQDMQEIKYLTSLEQVKTMADPLRLRIIDLLTHKAMTTTQLGEALGETAAKTHYHVHALERIGVIHLAETREKGGILEKFYLATAKNFSIAPEVLNTAPVDEITQVLQEWFRTIEQQALTAFTIITKERSITLEDTHVFNLSSTFVNATSEEMKILLHDIYALIEKHQVPRGIEGEQEWSMALIAHQAYQRPSTPAIPTEESATPAEKSSNAARATAKPSRAFMLGVTMLNRSELEQTIAEGRQMDLYVIGSCTFANDVTPDLIERAISRFRQRGILNASPEVREALKHKSNT